MRDRSENSSLPPWRGRPRSEAGPPEGLEAPAWDRPSLGLGSSSDVQAAMRPDRSRSALDRLTVVPRVPPIRPDRPNKPPKSLRKALRIISEKTCSLLFHRVSKDMICTFTLSVLERFAKSIPKMARCTRQSCESFVDSGKCTHQYRCQGRHSHKKWRGRTTISGWLRSIL